MTDPKHDETTMMSPSEAMTDDIVKNRKNIDPINSPTTALQNNGFLKASKLRPYSSSKTSPNVILNTGEYLSIVAVRTDRVATEVDLSLL
jgi:hypothetical protein